MFIIFLILGLLFGVSGLLSVMQISQLALDYLMYTQLHRLPLLNSIPVPWAYIVVGVVFLLLALLFYAPPGGYAWQKKEIK